MFTATANAAPKAKDEAANEGRKIVEDLKDGARRVKDEASNTASAVHEDLQDIARRTGKQVHEMADNVSSEMSDLTGTMRTRISENPLQAGAAILGLGVVLGMLMRR